MEWEEIRQQYPKQWLLVEAIDAHSESNKRIVDQLSVIDSFENSDNALRYYRRLHRKFPNRELYVLHTDRERIDISERKWLGIRGIQ
jgi:ribonuclease HIII